ncbi:MAG: HAMP domain-containing protein, partial [Spirochaetia bacterium]|nr:HAMP domain-containing protein [Spirochaetia bacterium]
LEIVAGQVEIKNMVKDFTDEMARVQPQLTKYGEVIDARIARNYTVIRVTEVASVLVLLGFFIFLGIFVPRYFAKPIIRLKETAERIASGDLTGEALDLNRKDELGDLAHSFNLMSGNLKNLLGEVAESVDQVAAGANQIAASSQALSQGSTEQASSLEEIASSATEITAQTNQNAQSAQKASRMSAEARDKAEQGNREMKELLSEMERISKSSDEVKKIVKVIDDIAFQTNLLALNANVEAARAGKYGRGFAVVAEEVRNLAARSAESATETTRMVEAILKNVASGNAKAEKTAVQLSEIVDGAMKVSELVEEINRASVEQTSALEQIQKGLSEIEIVTQSTVTQAEEGASASEELSAQAKSLRQIISHFKTTKDEGHGKENASAKSAARIPQTNGSGNGHLSGKSHALKSLALVTTDGNGKAHRAAKDVIHLENGDYQGF